MKNKFKYLSFVFSATILFSQVPLNTAHASILTNNSSRQTIKLTQSQIIEAYPSSNDIYKCYKHERTIRFGDNNDSVGKLQKFLNDHGYNLVVDYKFGTDTRNAVVNFQKIIKRNLLPAIEEDGVVGPKTWSVIDYIILTEDRT